MKTKPLFIHNGHFITNGHEIHIRGLVIAQGLIHSIVHRNLSPPPETKAIDLKGACLLPGFTDAHTHLIARGIELQRVDLESCPSANDCYEVLRNHVKMGQIPVFGSNYDDTGWVNLPARQDLDRLSRTVPIIMRRICGHYAVVNSAALKCIPRDWRIVNRATGELLEDAALYLNDIFKPDRSQMARAVALGSNEALRNGITSVHEIGSPERLALLQEIRHSSGLHLRFSMYILASYLDTIVKTGLHSGFGDAMLRFAGVKVFLDGSIGARTAALNKPYRNSRTRGVLLMSQETFEHLIQTAEHNCLQLMIHTIGDRASALAVRTLKKHVPSANPLHHRLEHCEVLDSKTIKLMASHHIIASMQPNFTRRWQQPAGLYEQRCGRRYYSMNCFKTLHDAGVTITFGSDCMPVGPLYGLPGAIEHPFSCGRLTRPQALNMYTRTAAQATFEEHTKGELRKGMYADFVVLDSNPLKAASFDAIKVRMVMVGGRIVYQAPGQHFL
jgi:predicted amidohydrolase YtcJ